MLCQHCNQNEADKTFLVNWMGTQYQMHVCESCLEQMWQYAGSINQQEQFRSFTGWWPGKEAPRTLGANPFPDDAGEDLKRQRQLAALRVRLAEAAKLEHYEEAARLRDSLAEMEQEAISHES